MKAEELKEILRLHKLWLKDKSDGCRANLSHANLSDANLIGANLRGADLRGADLSYALGNMKQIKTISLEAYHINYTKDVIQIGCENHSIEDWKNFSDERVSEMDGEEALTFWRKYKDFIFSAIELSPAEA